MKIIRHLKDFFKNNHDELFFLNRISKKQRKIFIKGIYNSSWFKFYVLRLELLLMFNEILIALKVKEQTK